MGTILQPGKLISLLYTRGKHMAKLKKRKLRWQASSSPQVIGYKLYWTEGGNVNYDSNQAYLGNVTEIVLPDDVDSFKPGYSQIEFGITSIDELGNESDIITFIAPYQFNIPKAPTNLEMVKFEQVQKKPLTKIDSDQMEAIELLELIANEQNQKPFSTNRQKKDNQDDFKVDDYYLLKKELKVGNQ
jgi:hypothetical protein